MAALVLCIGEFWSYILRMKNTTENKHKVELWQQNLLSGAGKYISVAHPTTIL